MDELVRHARAQRSSSAKFNLCVWIHILLVEPQVQPMSGYTSSLLINLKKYLWLLYNTNINALACLIFWSYYPLTGCTLLDIFIQEKKPSKTLSVVLYFEEHS